MNKRIIILDTETTGLDPKWGHRLTEIGLIEVINRQPTGRVFHTYLNPERELDAKAAEITGLSYERLRTEPKFGDILEDFLAFLEGADELIAHNAPFDIGFFNHELGLVKYPHLPLEQHYTIIDTRILGRKLNPGFRSYSLDALCKRYEIINDRFDSANQGRHGALLDADILTRLYLKMTSGQEVLAFEGEADIAPSEPNQANNFEIQIDAVQIQQTDNLKIVYATAEELALHDARLDSLIKVVS